MHTKSRTRTLAYFLAAFFVCGIQAHAVWTPIQNVEEYPYYNAQAASGGDTQIPGMWFQATSTFSIQEISFRMCKIGASTGSMYVVLATGTAASFTQIATSTGYDISQLNACSGAGTSTMAYANFSWNGNVYQFLEDEYVGIYIVVPSGTGDYFIHTFNTSYEAYDYWGRDTASTSWRQCRYWNFNSSGCVGNGTPQSIFFQVSTAGQAPIYAAYYNPVIENYEECDSAIDIGCHLSNAFVWLFYPSIPLSEQLEEISSTTAAQVPFGYVYDISDIITDYANNSTTTLSISIELSPLMNFLGGSYSSTSFTVLSGSGLRNTMGTTMWTFVQNLIKGLLWVGFMFYVYRRTMHIL